MNAAVPIYVEERRPENLPKPVFVARPLFFVGLHQRGEQLSRVMWKLARDLRKQLEEESKALRPQGVVDWTYAPELREEVLELSLSLKRATVNVRVLVASFEAMGRRLAVAPALDVWFEVGRGQTVKGRATEVLEEFFRKKRKDDEEYVPPPEVMGKARAWLTTLDIDVHPKPDLDTKKIDETLAALFGGGGKPSGRHELMETGRCLDWLYPDELERAILRDVEVAELAQLLDAAERRPVMLVGPRKVGKTAIVQECVFRRVMARGNPHQAEKNVWLLSPPRLISGMMYVGQWENRVLAIVSEAKEKDHVLYFDDLLGLYLAGMSRDSDLSVAHVLKPVVERREFRMLAEVTPEALRILQEKDRTFADLFHVIPVREPTAAQSRRILISVQRQVEDATRCEFSLDALPVVLDLQQRYVRDQTMPGKAAGFLRRLGAKHGKAEIKRQQVLDDFSATSGLSMAFLDARARLERREIVEALRKRIVGQAAALDAMADAVCVAKARLNDPGRPVASFLFLGPTGVGKTQCAKALAEYLFGHVDRMLRFDMNEYVEPGAATRLVGTFREPEGLLTAAIRRQPFSVILLDEIEKADPSVFDLLLQLLGEGRLSDALGRTSDFGSAIVIMTSNLGVREASSGFGFRPAELAEREAYVGAAERFFRPELFNRIDRIVPFERLGRDDVARIAEGLIAEVFRRDGLVHRRCVLQIDPAAMTRIVDQGFHPQLGARALKRSIERHLTQPVAARLAAFSPETAAVVSVFPAKETIAVQLDELSYIDRAPLIPAGVNLEDRDAILDAVDAVVLRVEEAIDAALPSNRMTQGQMSSGQFRWLAVREYARHVGRFIEALDRKATKPPTAGRTATVRTGRKRRVISMLDTHDVDLWRELRQGGDVRATLAARDLPTFGERGGDPLIELIHEAALLHAMATRPVDRVLLIARSLVPGELVANTPGLLGAYRELMAKDYGFVCEHLPYDDRWAAREAIATVIEMPGVGALLGGEEGVHLFTTSAGAMVPIAIRVIPLADDEDAAAVVERLYDRRRLWQERFAAGDSAAGEDPFSLGRVLRLYDAAGMTVDLRTGLAVANLPDGEALRRFMLARLEWPSEVLAIGSSPA